MSFRRTCFNVDNFDQSGKGPEMGPRAIMNTASFDKKDSSNGNVPRTLLDDSPSAAGWKRKHEYWYGLDCYAPARSNNCTKIFDLRKNICITSPSSSHSIAYQLHSFPSVNHSCDKSHCLESRPHRIQSSPLVAK